LDRRFEARNRDFPCKIPCLQGIWLETSAICTASPARHSRDRPALRNEAKMGRKSRHFAHSLPSPDSRLAEIEAEIPESLWPYPQIFAFCGDCRRRLGAIATAARPDHEFESSSLRHHKSARRTVGCEIAKIPRILPEVSFGRIWRVASAALDRGRRMHFSPQTS
jgi:hypothetical protein